MSDAIKSRLLIVDDDEAKRYTTSRLLRAEGFDVIEARDGKSALAEVQNQPDLVVLDVQMPDMSGYDVCLRIKSNPRTASIPVLHLSGTFILPEDRVHGLECGADGYLSDVVTPLELIATIRALLRAHRAEKLAVENQQRYQTLTETLPQLIWTCNPDGNCDYMSRQWVDFTGVPEAAHLGAGWLDALHPADRSRANTAWRHACKGLSIYDLEYRIRRHDGQYRWFQTRGVPLRNEAGEVIKWMGTCTDIHAQKEAERERAELLAREQTAREEAEEANRLKDEFLATLSHELRTPLNAILGWAQLLKLGHVEPAQLSEAVDTIERNARSQAQLIDDLLDVSRIISGKLRLDVQTVDLIAVIQAAIGSVSTAADGKGVQLQQMLDPKAASILGDAGRLQQVVWNLLSNAIKFTPKGGRVFVRLARVNSHVEISVGDTGRGIDPQFLPYVFDRFRQADASSRRTHGGLGLGLSIVRQLVELHGGSVSAHSDGIEKGAEFTVRLPLAAVIENPVEPVRKPIVKPDPPKLSTFTAELAGVRVLIVDDEPDARELLKRVLEECKAKVTAAASASDAFNHYEKMHPDVIVSDIGMPTEDGFDLIHRIREREATSGTRRVPAIALTAFARTEDRHRVMLAGFQAHVSKPVVPSELLAIIASLTVRS